jgi:hypothetical protein
MVFKPSFPSSCYEEHVSEGTLWEVQTEISQGLRQNLQHASYNLPHRGLAVHIFPFLVSSLGLPGVSPGAPNGSQGLWVRLESLSGTVPRGSLAIFVVWGPIL